MVPGTYDCVLDGYGYNFLRTIDTSLPFRTQRAMYSRSPTFVERSNVSNSYGDNAQDFFLTVRQRDWSLGEQQKFFRSGTDGRYWMGSNVDVSTPGQVALTNQSPSLSFSASVLDGSREANLSNINVASSTKLFRVTNVGTITDLSTHGLGAAPSRFGICSDGLKTYLSTTAAGTVGVRTWDGAATYATFSATGADSLAFLNNTLYGLDRTNQTLIRWDTAGVATTLFSWKTAAGATHTSQLQLSKIEAYGGKILILMQYGTDVGGELWIYDGTSTSRLEVFPPNFVSYDLEVLYGVAYISGSFIKPASATNYYMKPAVLFFDGSQPGKLWEANAYSATSVAQSSVFIGPHPPLGVVDGRLIWPDDTTGNLMAYNPALGGVSSIGTYTVTGDQPRIVTSGSFIVHTRNQTTGYYYSAAAYNTSGYAISSLIDFDSSLPKQFRGVKVEFDAASDGNGGSIDISYQVDSLTGSWTSLQTGAVSGTEYTFSNVSGHAVAIKVTLNKGTSTAGPVLKALNLRAAPVLQSYKLREFILDLSGRGGHAPVIVNDNESAHPLEGLAMATNLEATIAATTPFTVSDRFGSFTAVCQPDQCELIEVGPEEYIGRVRLREV